MKSRNQQRTIKISEESYQALRETAARRHGNANAVTWSGLVFELCREEKMRHP